jgi:threonine dehydrogenase-like Zn-dependent dehydrogenase
MANTRKAAALDGAGRISLVEEDVPPLQPGTVMVETHCSLVSPGTELKGGWRALKARRDDPKEVGRKKVFGYSNTGVVLETGEGAEEFKPGDRVACVGAGKAQHADYCVVPHNLCVPLPDDVSFARGTYAMLAATALHALRRDRPEFGERAAVLGLGLVGQLTAQLYGLAGIYVIGWDPIAKRVDVALGAGMDAGAVIGSDDPVEKTRDFTEGRGLDSAVVAIPGEADAAMEDLYRCMKVSPDGHVMGTIVIVGGTRFAYPHTTHNLDIVRAARTGPGYHDDDWEVGGPYPPVFMRWTTQTNLELCLRLIAEDRLKVDCLTSHTIPLEDVESGINAIVDDPDGILGVVFEMKQ